MIKTRAVKIGDPSGASEARRAAADLARREGFDEQDLGRIALVVTELSTNLVKHAGTGSVILSAGLRPAGRFFQAVTVDSGPGFDLSQGLRDGHSTSGSPGTGLGAIRRLSDSFDGYSLRGRGSVLFGEIRDRHAVRPEQRATLLLAAVSIAKQGEDECGDAWAAAALGDVGLVLVADGIGHGPEAAAAARQAVRTFEACLEPAPGAIVARLHDALRPTRGATVAVAAVDIAGGTVRYAGVGNVGGSIVAPGATRHMVSHNGTAGREARRIQEFSYPWPEDGLLVMASDGLSYRWDFEAYPGLACHHPAVVAGVLYRDFARGRDDATVVVGRQPRLRDAGLEKV